HGLAFGLGHGGIESVLIGLAVSLTLVNLAVIHRVGLENLVEPDQLDAARTSLSQLERVGAVGPALGALERLFAMPFHVAASLLVLRAVVEKRPGLVAVAVALHAALDGGVVALSLTVSPYAAEGLAALAVPLWVALIVTGLRALPKLERSAPQ